MAVFPNRYNPGQANGTVSAAVAAFTVVILTLSISPTYAMDTELNIYVLDVGQGDAMILHQPGHCSMLIDAGPPINGHRVTNKVEELGIKALDMAIVTHPHLDHFAGLFDLVPRVPVKHFYDNGMSNDAWEYFDDYVALRDSHPYKPLSRGMSLSCGDVGLEAIYPPATPGPGGNVNDTSLALLISFGEFRLLHMGDLAGEGEKRFLKLGDVPPADIIKIAHHGAIDSTSGRLLKAVSPQQALISTAAENRIGSPADEVLNRLADHHISYYRTDQTGHITIRIQSGNYQITTEHKSHK